MRNNLHCKELLNEDLIRFLPLYSLRLNAAPNTVPFLVHSVVHIARGLLKADKNEIAVHWPSESEMVNNNSKLCLLSCFSAVKIKVSFWWTHHCSRNTGNKLVHIAHLRQVSREFVCFQRLLADANICFQQKKSKTFFKYFMLIY